MKFFGAKHVLDFIGLDIKSPRRLLEFKITRKIKIFIFLNYIHKCFWTCDSNWKYWFNIRVLYSFIITVLVEKISIRKSILYVYAFAKVAHVYASLLLALWSKSVLKKTHGSSVLKKNKFFQSQEDTYF